MRFLRDKLLLILIIFGCLTAERCETANELQDAVYQSFCYAGILGLMGTIMEKIASSYPEMEGRVKTIGIFGSGAALTCLLAWSLRQEADDLRKVQNNIMVEDLNKAKKILKKIDPEKSTTLQIKIGTINRSLPLFNMIELSQFDVADEASLMHELGHIVDAKLVAAVILSREILVPLAPLLFVPPFTTKKIVGCSGGSLVGSVAKMCLHYFANVGLIGMALLGGNLVQAAMTRKLEERADAFACEHSPADALKKQKEKCQKKALQESSCIATWFDSWFDDHPSCASRQKKYQAAYDKKLNTFSVSAMS